MKQNKTRQPTPRPTEPGMPEKQGSCKAGIRSELYLCTPVINGAMKGDQDLSQSPECSLCAKAVGSWQKGAAQPHRNSHPPVTGRTESTCQGAFTSLPSLKAQFLALQKWVGVFHLSIPHPSKLWTFVRSEIMLYSVLSNSDPPGVGVGGDSLNPISSHHLFYHFRHRMLPIFCEFFLL